MGINKLAFFGGEPAARNIPVSYTWPRISDSMKSAVLRQMDDTLSIYDRSSVFAEFEGAFAEMHGRKHGLLFNSGTSAIHAMYDAIGLQPGDEVLCPVYTFHAAVSPMMSLGAHPVFVDSDEHGNIELTDLKHRRTERTKAVLITHMWGVPCASSKDIAEFCSMNNLFLLEDCSHAHGSEVDGQLVGTFGDVAAWSLQGQKTVTGGEGGILLTDHDEIFRKALIFGHYNKRPKTEIPKDALEYEYALTGKGLKLRAHPLGIAIAKQQLDILPDILRGRDMHAKTLKDAIFRFSFVKPGFAEDGPKSWYAFTFLFDEQSAHGLKREHFVHLLHAEGLSEFDIPGSTGLINELPLFTNPDRVYPGLYTGSLGKQVGFPAATRFYKSLIKLPVWAYDDEAETVAAYAAGFMKVAEVVASEPSLAHKVRQLLGNG